MSTWLDRMDDDPHGSVLAAGFGVIFEMMLGAIDSADLKQIRRNDGEWATTLPSADYGRFDDLSDLSVAENSTLIARLPGTAEADGHPVRDGLRVLRAVYRFGLLAWVLEASQREGGSPERHQIAQFLAQHFTDSSILTFVAGRAIEAAGDKRLAWWRLMLTPRGEDRVVTMSFIPALITAYLSLLMDLLPLEPVPDEPNLPTETWIEEYGTMLGDRIGRAWPLQSNVSFWKGDGDAQQDPRIGLRRASLAHAIESAVNDLTEARAMRIRRAPILPESRDLFMEAASLSWAAHRILGRTFHALGAPHSATSIATVELLNGTIPKAGFVGETSSIHVESYGTQAGTQAAATETAWIVELLGESLPASKELAATRRALAERVITSIREMRQAGYRPSLVLAPNTPGIWSRLAVDTTDHQLEIERLRSAGVPEYLLRFVRAHIEGVVVISPPVLVASSVLVIDAERALAVPARVRSLREGSSDHAERTRSDPSGGRTPKR